MCIRRTSFQVWNVIRINKQISSCASFRPPGFMKWVDVGTQQQYRDGLNLDISLLHCHRHKLSVEMFFLPAKNALWQTPWGQALSRVGKPPWGVHTDPDRNRYWLWTELCLLSGRCKSSACCKRTGTEDGAPIWMADHRLFRQQIRLSAHNVW